ncbi:MAG: site-specific DNA-methyltransferase [Nitrospirae bacterium]|nr:site-specific DNA-methyltransferase [Nitrospirota bacterium]
MANLNKQDIEFLMDCLKNGKEIPEVYKYAIFPTKQKEYELVYAGKMRKEDVLADTEEAKPVPLQIEKIFNGNKYPLFSKDWHNLLVFGDNLQILKTFNENKDPLVKNKIKGKVKLIYIDPPFGTGDEYDGNNGQSAYSARKKGADYVEFVRRRLILLSELLADDGIIFVRQGYNFSAYIKVILDEVFGKGNFINEIIVNRGKQRFGGKNKYSTATDTVFLYAKNPNYTFNSFKRSRYAGEAKGTNMLMKGHRNPPERTFIDPHGNKVVLLPPPNQHWKFIQSKLDVMYEKGVMYLAKSQKGLDSGITKIENGKKIPVDYVPSFKFDADKTIDSNWTDISGYAQTTDYPTENSEELLNRVIQTGTQQGDLVLDCFGGSGTTAIVAEKLGRRWITCDIGKLSVYTIQKRLLEIELSKDVENQKKNYSKPAKSFAVVTSGLYDLGKVFALQKDEYINFVKNLFEIEETKTAKISGVEIDGKKREFYAKIFPYWELKNASVDEKYLQELHKNIGKKIDGRFYIIAPANNVDFISDYHEIGDVRYYFLKVPYQIIKELHKVQFKKFRQPQSKSQINDLDEAIGFHFIRQPEVKSEIKKLKDKVVLKIKKFESAYSQDETGEKLKNFESLAMLLVDLNYDGEKFMMTNYYFAQDLLNHKTDDKEESEEEIKKELKKQIEIIKEFPKKDCGKEIMAIYVDIYGNEFREVFKVK